MSTAYVLEQLQSALTDRYRIERELGRGGMAMVYLARDVKHDRLVALKMLHPDLAAALGAERFLAEIKTTANLQHPHILPLHDSGEAAGSLFYVMPYVEGETLRARLEREGPLPIDDARRLTREVLSALDYAHRHGVVHRDIKPENILLHDGSALVADFGIALAVQQASGPRMTQTGLSLGTPQYMSPEQAMGEKHVDGRADVYATGAVLYEMLTGEPPFSGASVQAIVAKVMTERPTPPSTVRETVPPHIERAVLEALAKLPADRFAGAREFADALALPAGAILARGVTASAARGRWDRLVAVLPWAAVVVASTLALWGWLRPARDEAVMRIAMAFPNDQAFLPRFFGFSVAISPDGRRLAYIGRGASAGDRQVWVRSLDALRATALPGTSNAYGVQWSPDGRSLLIQTSGTAVSTIVSADGTGSALPLQRFVDATWTGEGRVYGIADKRFLVRQAISGALDTLYRADSGVVMAHPAPIRGGRSALFVRGARTSIWSQLITLSDIVAVTFKSGRLTMITQGVYARVLASGSLLYVTADGNVFVAPFDQSALRITGKPVAIARVALAVTSGRVYPQISVSDEGTIVYVAGHLQQQRLVWLDPNGRRMREVGIEGDIWGIALSPDASRVAFSLFPQADDAASRNSAGLWVADLATGARTRLTDTLVSLRPSWSPDGRSVLYAGGSDRIARSFTELRERRADASEPERLVLSSLQLGHSVGDGRWLPDHHTLVLRTYGDLGASGPNIYYTGPGGDGGAHPVAVTPAAETAPAPSPDGSLLAYMSDESGTFELYVQRFPSGGGRIVVSHGGASPARWSHDGRSLYYWDNRGRLIVASITERPVLAVTSTREIQTDATPDLQGGNNNFDVAPDGRILVAEAVTDSLNVVLVRNWRR